MLYLIACFNKTQVLTEVQIQKVQIPNELLKLELLKKPIVENELDN